MIEIPIWLFALNCIVSLAFFIETMFFPRNFKKESDYNDMRNLVADQTKYIFKLQHEIITLRQKYE